MRITPETTIGKMLYADPGIADVLAQCGMHCVGCPSSAGETLEQACEVHGLFIEDVLEAIEEYHEACWQNM